MSTKRDLTDRALKALKPAPKGTRLKVWDAQVAGFGARVTDGGHVSFILLARYPGATWAAPRAIGDFPTMGLSEAREIARQWKREIAQGIDPRDRAEAAQKAAEAAKRAEEMKAKNTFEAAWREYVEERRVDRNGRNRTLDVVNGVITKHILPKLGARPLSEIGRAETNDVLRQIAKGTPTHARRIASYLGTFGRWAENDGRIEDGESPFDRLKKLGTENRRDRVLTDLEIRAIWLACTGMGAFGHAIRLLLATGQRRSEVGDLAWREIEGGVWTLPAERTKPGRAHLVPLSPLALSILAETPKLGGHVFTTRSTPKGETIPISGWSKSKARLDDLAIEALRKLIDDDEATIPAWHLHDLRRTAATLMTRRGVSRLIVGKVLNHAEQGVTGQHYDMHDYIAEKRQALDLWGARLAAIVEGKDSDNVIAFERAQG
jgi:integrase